MYSQQVEKEIRKVGDKAYFTNSINTQLKNCVKGHWLQGHIFVPIAHAQAAEIEYLPYNEHMVKVVA